MHKPCVFLINVSQNIFYSKTKIYLTYIYKRQKLLFMVFVLHSIYKM